MSAVLSARAADECRDLRVSIDLSQKQLEEFTTLEAELNEKYHKYVSEDFVNQADGGASSLSHGSAVKVVFAQKRLKSAIEGKQMTLLSARSEFCQKCGTVTDPAEKANFCQRCPAHDLCRVATKEGN